MRDVCIVTLFKTINSGSFLQAKALGITLERMGYTVSYYDTPFSFKNKVRLLTVSFKILFKEGTSNFYKYSLSLIEFRRAQKKFKVVKTNNLDNIDCFVLGSDTIWNVLSRSLRDNYSIYWGSHFKKFKKKIITYAGSISDSPDKLFLEDKYSKAVDLWTFIGVRDDHTKKVISSLTDKRVHVVCDPTFLLNKSDYTQFMISPKCNYAYIYIYMYNELSRDQIIDLQAYARERNLKILQGMSNGKLSGIDSVVINAPYYFLGYMMNAAFVVTDTFHGAAFSLNFEKQFVVIDRGRNKINSLLKDLDFSERIITDKDLISDYLNMTIDYSNRLDALNELREQSRNYLRFALSE